MKTIMRCLLLLSVVIGICSATGEKNPPNGVQDKGVKINEVKPIVPKQMDPNEFIRSIITAEEEMRWKSDLKSLRRANEAEKRIFTQIKNNHYNELRYDIHYSGEDGNSNFDARAYSTHDDRPDGELTAGGRIEYDRVPDIKATLELNKEFEGKPVSPVQDPFLDLRTNYVPPAKVFHNGPTTLSGSVNYKDPKGGTLMFRGSKSIGSDGRIGPTNFRVSGMNSFQLGPFQSTGEIGFGTGGPSFSLSTSKYFSGLPISVHGGLRYHRPLGISSKYSPLTLDGSVNYNHPSGSQISLSGSSGLGFTKQPSEGSLTFRHPSGLDLSLVGSQTPDMGSNVGLHGGFNIFDVDGLKLGLTGGVDKHYGPRGRSDPDYKLGFQLSFPFR